MCVCGSRKRHFHVSCLTFLHKETVRKFPKVIEMDLEAVYLSNVTSKSVIEKEFRTEGDEPILHFNMCR